MKPKYPIFIPTKGRYKTPLTINALKKIGVRFKAVIEEPEYKEYSKVLNKKNIIILPHKDKGLAATRNWIWDHAENLKVKRFWTFDDNISRFHRMNKNIKWKCTTGNFLKAIEDFVDRYENVDIAGLQYSSFYVQTKRNSPFYLNRRIYSNMLINTSAKDGNGKPLRNECFYNDDTDLCLRVLKNNRCTLLFYVFLAKKEQTMVIKGGMTDLYNKTNRRYEFAKELVDKHPDVCRMIKRYGRWHHWVNYKPFQNNRLIKRKDIEIPKGINNYGMKMIEGKIL